MSEHKLYTDVHVETEEIQGLKIMTDISINAQITSCYVCKAFKGSNDDLIYHTHSAAETLGERNLTLPLPLGVKSHR